MTWIILFLPFQKLKNDTCLCAPTSKLESLPYTAYSENL